MEIENKLLGVKFLESKKINITDKFVSAKDFVIANSNPFYKNKLNQYKLQTKSALVKWAVAYKITFNYKSVLPYPAYIRIPIFLIYFALILFKSIQVLSLKDINSHLNAIEIIINFYFKLKFWWWVNLEKIVLQGDTRLTAVNIIINQKNKLLLAKRHNNWIPGDIGWAWFQGGVDKKDKTHTKFNFAKKKLNLSDFEKTLINAGIRELCEETSFVPGELQILVKPRFSGWEIMSVSFRRFLYQGCRYYRQKKYLVFLKALPKKKIKVNWENEKAQWFSLKKSQKLLVPEKLADLYVSIKYLEFNN